MDDTNNLVVQVKEKAIDTLGQLQKAVQESQISSFEIKNDGATTTVIINSLDKKERIIDTKYSVKGYNESTLIRIKKTNPTDRKEIVKKLYEEGKTQSEIAQKTLVSQKTISNDIKKLKKENLIKDNS
jgi:DNA-binding NarL/FixJ family response regulator